MELRRRWHKLIWWVLDLAISDEGHVYWKRAPELPSVLRRPRYRFARHAPRLQVTTTAPPALQTAPGVVRDEEAAWEAYRQAPLRNFWCVYLPAEMWIRKHWIRFLMPAYSRYLRAIDRVAESGRNEPDPNPESYRPEQLSRLIRAEAARLGMTSVGFTAYDPRYVYYDNAAELEQGSVIICVLEEDYESEQLGPSRQHERMTYECYISLYEMTAKLGEFIQSLGVRAQPHDASGPMMYIPFAVQAGLGQMGFNGQLLTPGAGARVTLTAINTNAELAHDEPVDFGIPGICAECRVCVRRCPVGAIPAAPAVHRGVTKTKIKTERCLPVIGQAEGCAVCVKVCPIQRFGVDAVTAYYNETGQIIGKDSDDLEGYRWPLDRRYYGVGQKPRINSDTLLHPPELEFDPKLLYEPLREGNVIDEYVASH